MYAKIDGGVVTHFPYTFGDLRRDNPNVSFPRSITQGIMQKYGMVGVLEGLQPTPTAYQTVRRNALPTQPVVDGVTADYWMINYSVVDIFSDTTDENGVTTTKAEHETAYQARLDATAGEVARTERNRLLAETDYFALTDVTMNAAMTTYRQNLRDITAQEGFPNDVVWPEKPS